MKWLLRIWWAAFLIGFFGCVSHLGQYHYTRVPPVTTGIVFPVYVDKNFGEADKISIQNALDQWNYALNGHAKLVIVDDKFDMDPDELKKAIEQNAFLILKIRGDNPIVPDLEPGYWSLGFTPYVGSHWVYLIRDRLRNDDVKYITMHELGHALGAHHTPSGVMFRHYFQEEYQCVDYLAVAQVASWYHWDMNSMNYCLPGLESGKDQKSGQPQVDVIGR